MKFKIERVPTENKYGHKAVLTITDRVVDEMEMYDLMIIAKGSELETLFDAIGNYMTKQISYQFTEVVDGHTYSFNVDGGEPATYDCPESPAFIEDLAIVINGMAIPFDDEIEELEYKLLELAAESLEEDFDEPDVPDFDEGACDAELNRLDL